MNLIEVNKLIIEKIDSSNKDKALKEFLKEIIRFERDNYPTAPGLIQRYTNEYRRISNKFINKKGVPE